MIVNKNVDAAISDREAEKLIKLRVAAVQHRDAVHGWLRRDVQSLLRHTLPRSQADALCEAIMNAARAAMESL